MKMVLIMNQMIIGFVITGMLVSMGLSACHLISVDRSGYLKVHIYVMKYLSCQNWITMKDTVILRNEGFINVEVIPMCGSDNIVLSSSHSIGNDYRGNNIILSTKGQHK